MKNKKILHLLILLFLFIIYCLIPSVVSAKPEMITWEKTDGGSEDDWASSINQTSDGGYIIAGETYSKGIGKEDAWIMKLDNQGNLLWEKTYGGSNGDKAWIIIQTIDGGYALAGTTSSQGAGEEDLWLIKLDENGNLESTPEK